MLAFRSFKAVSTIRSNFHLHCGDTARNLDFLLGRRTLGLSGRGVNDLAVDVDQIVRVWPCIIIVRWQPDLENVLKRKFNIVTRSVYGKISSNHGQSNHWFYCVIKYLLSLKLRWVANMLFLLKVEFECSSEWSYENYLENDCKIYLQHNNSKF